jgi:hypothetical protein
MKSSIGSLAALAAAVVAPAVSDAATVSASFSNLTVSGVSQWVDIDGNTTDDVLVFANGAGIYVQANNPTLLFFSEFLAGQTVPGSGVPTIDGYTSVDFVREPSDVTYVGLLFDRSAALHSAWLRFETDGFNNLLLTNGGWETSPGVGAAIPAAIPEPSSFGALAGLAALAGAAARRRRGATGR